MKLKLSPFSEEDLDESIKYFNSQKDGLAYKFVNEVVNTFNRILENHTQFPKLFKDLRKAKTSTFSFNIFFVCDDEYVYVLGIFHTSRNPKIMNSRFKIHE